MFIEELKDLIKSDQKSDFIGSVYNAYDCQRTTVTSTTVEKITELYGDLIVVLEKGGFVYQIPFEMRPGKEEILSLYRNREGITLYKRVVTKNDHPGVQRYIEWFVCKI